MSYVKSRSWGIREHRKGIVVPIGSYARIHLYGVNRAISHRCTHIDKCFASYIILQKLQQIAYCPEEQIHVSLSTPGLFLFLHWLSRTYRYLTCIRKQNRTAMKKVIKWFFGSVNRGRGAEMIEGRSYKIKTTAGNVWGSVHGGVMVEGSRSFFTVSVE